MKEKLKLFTHTFAKVTPTCLMLMVQGDVTAVALKHWIIAGKVGLLTGLILLGFSFTKYFDDISNNNYSMAGLVALATAVADYNTHATHFGGATTEAIVTGLAAGLLWFGLTFTPLGRLK